MAKAAMSITCNAKIIITGNANPANCHNFRDINAMARNKDKPTLPKTSTAESATLNLNTWVRVLRMITPVNKHHTKVGKANAVPLVCASKN